MTGTKASTEGKTSTRKPIKRKVVAKNTKTTAAKSKKTTAKTTEKSTAVKPTTENVIAKPKTENAAINPTTENPMTETKVAEKKASGVKRTRAKKANDVTKPIITSEERQRMIAEAAYYKAEQRGFQGGNPEDDWIEAAAEVDRMIIEAP